MKAIYRNIKAAFAALILSVSGVAINAQTLPSLMLDQDPASLALGMSGVASQAGAFAIQNNVAAISLSEKTLDAQAGFGTWQPSYSNLKTIGAGAVYRMGKLGFGVDVKMLKLPSYSGVSGNGSDIRDSEFSPSEMNLAAGASYAVMDCLSAGVTLRYTGSNLAADASAAVFGADIALYYAKEALSAGISINNIGSKVKYSETAYPQPMMAKIGAGYDIDLGTSALAFTAEADVIFTGGIMAGAGCEYSFKDMVFARAGYHYGNSVNAVPSYASAGLGLNVFGAQLNFAYLFASPVLANSMCVSLGYSF